MKIIFATGGTGGHLFPALKVAQELKDRGHEIFFLGSFDKDASRMKKSGFTFQDLHARGLTLTNGKDFIQSVILILKASFTSWRLLKVMGPQVVIGFGGYGAFPVVLSAILLGYPTMIHEQNVVPGKANALLAKFVKKIAISFQKSSRYFEARKTILTGCPCNIGRGKVDQLDKRDILKNFHLKENKTTIMVLGGSQGSHRINEEFMRAAEGLKEQLDFQAIHISGKSDYPQLQTFYSKLGIPFALFEFLEEIDCAYRIAHLVISRAGAVTVTEIALFHVPAILIPYPYAQGHQKANALILSEANVATLIEEKDLSAERLKNEILNLLNHQWESQTIEPRIKEICIPDAAQRLAHEVVTL